jgi:hypothetical protein
LTHTVYCHKITGEITGVLTGFSGDRGTFELFRNRLRNYTKQIEREKKEIDIDDIIWHIHEIKAGFLNTRGRYNFELMIGVSSRFYRDGKSALYHFYDNGGYIPINKYKAIGQGKIHTLYII